MESKSRWKNKRPSSNCAYEPTYFEHLANIWTHGLFILPVIYLSVSLVVSSSSKAQLLASSIYGSVLIGLFSISTLFHIFSFMQTREALKEIFHRGDRAMIYLFIAGSYTPWLSLKSFSQESLCSHLDWGIWILSLFGIMYQHLFHEKYKSLETFFYIFIAGAPSFAVTHMRDEAGIKELQMGGAVFLLGVLFFKSDGILPFAHALWHLTVVIGALIHYYAVKTYLIVSHDDDNNQFV